MSSGDPAPDGSHGPHALVADVADPVLGDDDRHHLVGSLRLREGDRLTVGDGFGAWVPCVLGAEPRPVGDIRRVPAREPQVGVAFALIKGGRPELVVQKLTELGVDRIIPFTADRSVVRWDTEKARRNVERFGRVAREAVMQCRRTWIPTIDEVAVFDEVAALPGAVMADRTGTTLGKGDRILIVGPEGGWSERERDSEISKVCIAANVLRAETAAISGAALMVAAREGLVRWSDR